jgi:DNA polymerase III alpha subunit
MSTKHLPDHFIRSVPGEPAYEERLNKELSWFRNTIAEEYLLIVANICKNVKDIPHTIRGSAGSSLIVYLLGISDIDPIKWKIEPERFFHPKRKDLPDIDLDFPDDRRDEVFERIQRLYPGRTARISNHVTYKDKSAIREAVRILGYRKRLKRGFKIGEAVPGRETEAIEIAADLKGQVKDLSLHCGGVIVFDKQVPESLSIIDKKNQLRIDKHETELMDFFKIDILSNISLTQLNDCDSRPILEYPPEDQKVSELLSQGNSLGITQAESPAFQKMLRAVKPKSVNDMIMCMALIRPASAWRGHRVNFMEEWNKERDTDFLIFEDDATKVIQEISGFSGPEADALRRAFAKKDHESTREFRELIANREDSQTLIADLEAFKSFSMCKSHSVAYGHVAWALAWNKVYNPRKFWKSVLNRTQPMWRPWVHVEEAKKAGWNIIPGKRPFIEDGDSLYGQGFTPQLFASDPWWELKKYKMWSGNSFPKECGRSDDGERVEFFGIVGTHRILKRKDGRATTFATIGTSQGNYLDLILDGAIDLKNTQAISGKADLGIRFGSEFANVKEYRLI